MVKNEQDPKSSRKMIVITLYIVGDTVRTPILLNEGVSLPNLEMKCHTLEKYC